MENKAEFVIAGVSTPVEVGDRLTVRRLKKDWTLGKKIRGVVVLIDHATPHCPYGVLETPSGSCTLFCDATVIRKEALNM